MTVFTYFTALDQISLFDEKRLMIIWEKSWAKHGFKPFVLSEYHAAKHPLYAEYDKAISALPSINPGGYDRACFLRWLALAATPALLPGELCLMTDYDVLCYAPFEQWPVLSKVQLLKGKARNKDVRRINSVLGLQKYVPSVVLGTPAMFEAQAKRFMAFDPATVVNDPISAKILPVDARHLSDQLLLCAQCEKGELDTEHVVKSYGEERWEQAPAVHYPNAAMQGKQPRWQFVEGLR